MRLDFTGGSGWLRWTYGQLDSKVDPHRVAEWRLDRSILFGGGGLLARVRASASGYFLGGLFESGLYPDTTFGPAPGAAHRLAARIRALRMNEATAKRNLKTARIFVIESPTSTPAVPDRNDTETDTKKGSRTYKNGRRRYEAAERHDRQCRIATRQCESEQDQLRPCVEIGALARLLPLLFRKTRKRVRKRAKPRDVRIPAGSRR